MFNMIISLTVKNSIDKFAARAFRIRFAFAIDIRMIENGRQRSVCQERATVSKPSAGLTIDD